MVKIVYKFKEFKVKTIVKSFTHRYELLSIEALSQIIDVYAHSEKGVC